MPHFTSGNKRMTNVSVGNGEYISGIRKNENLGKEELMMSGRGTLSHGFIEIPGFMKRKAKSR